MLTLQQWALLATVCAYVGFMLWSLTSNLQDARAVQRPETRTPAGRLVLYGVAVFAVLALVGYSTGSAATTPFRLAMLGLVIATLVMARRTPQDHS